MKDDVLEVMQVIPGRAYLHRQDGKAGRQVTVSLTGGRLREPATLHVEGGGFAETTEIETGPEGRESISIALPEGVAVENRVEVSFTLKTAGQVLRKTASIHPLRQWTVYIYPHSHVDIGYTAPQETVKKLHMRNIDVGIDIAKETAGYPEGAQFVWNPEVTWAVEGYLEQADSKKRNEFVAAVRRGSIGLNATFGNQNTSVSSDEEIIRLFQYCHDLRELTGAPIETMVQFDIPGASWGTVQAAAQNGVRGFFLFPNHFDRIGTARVTWDQKAFYWVAPDRKTRIFFMQGWPYGYGYLIKGSDIYGLEKIQTYTPDLDRLRTGDPTANFLDPFIFDETARLEEASHPYEIFVMTWAMADNALIDVDLPEAVRLWNEKYAYPKLVIAGTDEIMGEFERRYSGIIPEVEGDYTEYWTDGQGTDARRAGMNRRAKERLVQAEILWSMLDRNGRAPLEAFRDSWRWVLLGSEHTWGYCYPEEPVAGEIEATKASYFENADRTSRELLENAASSFAAPGSDSIAVLNTQSWKRSGLIILTAGQSRAGDCVLDDGKRKVPSQRLTTGELAFQASDIPAFGSRLYHLTADSSLASGDCSIAANTIGNSLIQVDVDPGTGNISRLIDRRTMRDYVDGKSRFGMNSYWYLPGSDRSKASSTRSSTVSIRENGPLLASLVVESDGEGCNSITRELRVVAGQPHVELVNTLDKISTREKEGVHFGFPFNVPGGTVRMDIPWGIMTPETDQLAGANRNWLAFQRWIDVSDADGGITWVSMESPVVQFGDLTANILGGANGSDEWIQVLPESETVISWALNNHWHTNFPLEQGGRITFQYQLLPHGDYKAAECQRFALNSHQPLLAVPAGENPVEEPFLSIDNPNVFVSAAKPSEDGKAVILRLRSLSDKTESVRIEPASSKAREFSISSAGEERGMESSGNIDIPSLGAATIRMEL